jgi:hypothetical protein
MRIGAENRTQIIILAILGALLLIAMPRFFSGGSGQQTPQASGGANTLTARRIAGSSVRASKRPPQRKAMLTASLDPSLRFDLLNEGERQQYEGSKRNIFSERAEVVIPKPVDDGRKIVHVDPGPVLPPPPPPIPLKFYGFAAQTGQAKRVFLSSTTSDDIFVGSEGQVINKRYRIVKIENAAVVVEDIPNNNQQRLALSPPS